MTTSLRLTLFYPEADLYNLQAFQTVGRLTETEALPGLHWEHLYPPSPLLL